MKPLTSAEIRERIALAPAEMRPVMIEIAWSAYDMGQSGLVGQARMNPFEHLLQPPKTSR